MKKFSLLMTFVLLVGMLAACAPAAEAPAAEAAVAARARGRPTHRRRQFRGSEPKAAGRGELARRSLDLGGRGRRLRGSHRSRRGSHSALRALILR